MERTLKNIVKMRYEDGVLKVTANWFLSNRKLREIIEQNTDWIRRQKTDSQTSKAAVDQPKKVAYDREEMDCQIEAKAVAKVSTKQVSRTLKDELLDGTKTVIMGDVVSVVPSANSKTYLDGNLLYVASQSWALREGRFRAIKGYLKKMDQLYVAVEIANFGSSVSQCPARIEFKDVGEFWVKCSAASQRNLCVDFRIAQLPNSLRNYVIAHAFAHFVYPIHDDRFWNFIANAIPNYKDVTRQLDRYRFLLDI